MSEVYPMCHVCERYEHKLAIAQGVTATANEDTVAMMGLATT